MKIKVGGFWIKVKLRYDEKDDDLYVEDAKCGYCEGKRVLPFEDEDEKCWLECIDCGEKTAIKVW